MHRLPTIDRERVPRRRHAMLRRAGTAARSLAAAGMLLLAAFSCTTKDLVTGEDVYNFWTLDDDIEMGQDIMQELKKAAREEDIPINQDKRRKTQLDQMLRQITAVSHAPELPFDVTLLQTDIVNACALPGGQVVVFSGLYDDEDGIVKNDRELAAVMAHEVAHVVCRHSTKEMTRNMPVELLLMGGSIYAEYLAEQEKDEKGRKKSDDEMQTSEIIQLAIAGAYVMYQGLVVTKFSRDDEFEADRIGLLYMAKAGYDPQAAVKMWQRVAKDEGEPLAILSLLSTHPPSSERAKALQALMPEAEAAFRQTRADGPTTPPATPQDAGGDGWFKKPGKKNPDRKPPGKKPRRDDDEADLDKWL